MTDNRGGTSPTGGRGRGRGARVDPADPTVLVVTWRDTPHGWQVFCDCLQAPTHTYLEAVVPFRAHLHAIDAHGSEPVLVLPPGSAEIAGITLRRAVDELAAKLNRNLADAFDAITAFARDPFAKFRRRNGAERDGGE